MSEDPRPLRAPARTTALGALAIFVPLVTVLLRWVFENRVENPGRAEPALGTIPVPVAVAASLFVAGAAATLAALVLANHARLRQLLRPSRGKVIAAVVLFLLTPSDVFQFVPFLIPGTAYVGWGETDTNVLAWLVAVALCWVAGAATVSGIRSRALRVAVLSLC